MSSSIRFAGEMPPAVVLLLSVTTAAVVFWLYFRESRKVASPYRYLLPTLRAAAVAFAIAAGEKREQNADEPRVLEDALR